MSTEAFTVTVAVASVKLDAVARIVAEPAEAPVTGMVTLVALAGIVALGPTVATAELLDVRLNVIPPVGAGPDNVSVRFCVCVPEIVRF
jgi:hypothetical protein